jgi:hypothetical protein
MQDEKLIQAVDRLTTHVVALSAYIAPLPKAGPVDIERAKCIAQITALHPDIEDAAARMLEGMKDESGT